MPHDLPTAKDWGQFKDTIRNLYIVEGRPLKGEDGVIELMGKRFNFKKT